MDTAVDKLERAAARIGDGAIPAERSARGPLVDAAARIAVEIAGPAAAEVDRDARFPREAVEALRKEKLLGCFVPRELGGQGATLTELSGICQALGQQCSAAAMVFAMHQIQVACFVRHGMASPYFRQYMQEELVGKQALLASATTEVGVGGDVRTSLCAVEAKDGHFRLQKLAPVISYGEHADDILVTSRRTPDAPSSDQVIVLARKAGTRLEQTNGWDTLGFRGTCSLGFKLTTEGKTEQILPTPYAEISSQTMLPVSHVTWTSLWLGMATDAVNRARAFVRGEARKKPGTMPPAGIRLAELVAVLQGMRANVESCTREYESLMHDREALSGMGFAIRMNNLKVSTSQLLIQVVGAAMTICGMAGYKMDSKFSLGRHLRDAHGASLMINNDRIYNTNASLLLVAKDEL